MNFDADDYKEPVSGYSRNFYDDDLDDYEYDDDDDEGGDFDDEWYEDYDLPPTRLQEVRILIGFHWRSFKRKLRAKMLALIGRAQPEDEIPF